MLFDDGDNKERIESDVEKEDISELDCNVENGGNNGDNVPELRRGERIKKPLNYLEDLNLILTIYQKVMRN
jgi:hypothetical protein